MASGSYVWGIDIGKCALKALRCRVSAEPRKLEAVACEYIEYPMILSQPEADPTRTGIVGFCPLYAILGINTCGVSRPK